MPGTFRIGKIAGIDIDIHVSWIIILVLLTVSLATGWFPQLYPGWSTATYWLIAFLSSLLLFVSVLLHELAHSLVASRRGLPVKSITLFIFGGFSNIEREPKTPGIEFQMAFVGPLTSLAIGVICFLLQVPLRGSNSPLSTAMIPLSRLHVATPQQSLSDVLPLMAGRDVNKLPVVENGALVGILSRDSIVHYLEVRRSPGVENAKRDAHDQTSRVA